MAKRKRSYGTGAVYVKHGSCYVRWRTPQGGASIGSSDLFAAFVLASVAAVAVAVHAIPLLIERGHSPPFAASAVGLIEIPQTRVGCCSR
jgi:hypothetical protein